MPTYEYKCDACGNEFERFQSMSAEPVKRCPECGKAKVRRLIGTGAGLIFKGSGFYITDYREKGYADQAKAESGGGEAKSDAKAETASGGESKTESKPAASEPKGEAKPAASKPEPKPKGEPKPKKK
jgi:putative FmdB family regulatory protein